MSAVMGVILRHLLIGRQHGDVGKLAVNPHLLVFAPAVKGELRLDRDYALIRRRIERPERLRQAYLAVFVPHAP